jgi:hypothetical protein
LYNPVLDIAFTNNTIDQQIVPGLFKVRNPEEIRVEGMRVTENGEGAP